MDVNKLSGEVALDEVETLIDSGQPSIDTSQPFTHSTDGAQNLVVVAHGHTARGFRSSSFSLALS